MCGIFGVINKRIDKELAKKCLDTIVHRGPDAEGLWQEEAVTLGHRRLAILDLSEKESSLCHTVMAGTCLYLTVKYITSLKSEMSL